MGWRLSDRPLLKRWIYAFAWWTGVVLVYATRNDLNGQPITLEQAFKVSAARWYVWAILSYFIIAIDERLINRSQSLWKSFLVHAPISLVFIAAYTYLNYWASVLLGAPINVSVSTAEDTAELLSRAFLRPSNLVYWVIVVTHRILSYENQKKDQQVKTATLERLLAEARLATLRSQLHPHFLFNSLNAISAYIDTTPRTARLMLEQLGDLLRMSLEHHEAQEIPLHQELAFLDKYLDLQKMRFEDRLEVSIHMDPNTSEAMVPTFILQPLVENAVRHGVAARHEKGTVEISAWRANGNLGISVRDNGPGLPHGWTIESFPGVGLSNTRDRLETLYGHGKHLDVTNADGGGVLVNVTLPFHTAAPATHAMDASRT